MVTTFSEKEAASIFMELKNVTVPIGIDSRGGTEAKHETSEERADSFRVVYEYNGCANLGGFSLVTVIGKRICYTPQHTQPDSLPLQLESVLPSGPNFRLLSPSDCYVICFNFFSTLFFPLSRLQKEPLAPFLMTVKRRVSKGRLEENKKRQT
jgi:hypothetical protein